MHVRLKQWLMVVLTALACGWMPASAIGADTDTSSAQQQAARQQTQPGNNSPFWNDVRGGDNPYQTTQVRGIESSVLVQPAGETWRQLRNGPITIYGGCGGLDGYEELLGQLGTYTRSKVCIYVKRMSDVDQAVLRAFLVRSVEESRAADVGPEDKS